MSHLHFHTLISPVRLKQFQSKPFFKQSSKLTFFYMEITAFPFLNQQDDDSSQFLGLFQDMDYTPSLGHNLDKDSKNEDYNKRPRKDEFGGESLKDSEFGDILATLLLLDEEAKQEQGRWDFESRKDKSLIESNHRDKVREMDQYYDQLQNHYRKSAESIVSGSKRTKYAAAAAAAAVVNEDTAEAGDPGQNPSGSGSGSGPGQRRLWVKERPSGWWDRVNSPDFPEEDFRREFRMSKPTFNLICDELDAAVTKKNTMLRDAIPVPKRVGVCIWRLATGAPLRQVSERFGLGISTCHKLVIEVCHAIHTVLMPKYLRWPSGDQEIRSTQTQFESVYKIPNVIGSIYTTHVPIIAPKVHVGAYFNKRHTERNQKTSYSITVQGVVNPAGIFTDVSIGNPGSLSDDQILEKSSLFRQHASRGLLRDVWIVGNAGFPLTDWLLVPYTHKNMTWTQHAFNERVYDINRVAKEAFGRLKGRWASLQKRTEIKLQDLPYVLGACCVLHNICELRKEEMDRDSAFEVFDDEIVPENNSVRSANAIQARDQIAHNLLHQGLAGTSFFVA